MSLSRELLDEQRVALAGNNHCSDELVTPPSRRHVLHDQRDFVRVERIQHDSTRAAGAPSGEDSIHH